MKIIFEDDDIVVIDKPTGVVVHEGAGEIGETVADWLVKQYPQMKELFGNDHRPGIVHRLDKNTSGILICAKNPMARAKLQEQFKARTVVKKYQTLVLGEMRPEQGTVETYISRNPKNRQLMKVEAIAFDNDVARHAISEYKTLKTFDYNLKKQPYKLALLEIDLKTGRMHQIRAHMKFDGHPVIGDPDYNTKPSKKISQELGLERQFLHATHTEINHPVTGEKLIFDSKLPEEFQNVLNKID